MRTVFFAAVLAAICTIQPGNALNLPSKDLNQMGTELSQVDADAASYVSLEAGKFEGLPETADDVIQIIAEGGTVTNDLLWR